MPIIAAIRSASDPRRVTAAAAKQAHLPMKRPAIIAIGKAAPAMLEGFLDARPGEYEKIMVVPNGVSAPPWAILADHPVPTVRCRAAAEKVARFTADLASGAAGHDGFIVLLSGGASALLTWPVPELPFDAYASAIKELLSRGTEIRVLNAFRKHCERLKGGRLGLMMNPLPCTTFVLSDVIGDELSTVGSGPTLPDPTTFEDACKPFEWELEFSEMAIVAERYLDEGRSGVHEDTPKPGDPRLSGMQAVLVGSISLAVAAAVSKARECGWKSVDTIMGVTGDASTAGRMLIAKARAAVAPRAIVMGGETTVDVGKHDGRGGRNQELALAAALEIENTAGSSRITVASFATDGVDGPTDAAGAIVTGETCHQARQIGLDPVEALARHDSYTFFTTLEKAGFPHLIRTGPTGTNVNDVAIALIY